MQLIVPYKEDTPERAANKAVFLDYYKDYDVVLVEDYETRAEVYNMHAYLSDAEYIALADIDCLIPHEQMKPIADVTYPYTWIPGWPRDQIYGLMVIFNRQKFLDMGGENEDFIGWGYEDHERYYRALNHGYSVERIHGPAIHMWHPESSRKNPHLLHNARLMKKEQALWRAKVGSDWLDTWLH